jgi:hypothetical protein
MKKRIWFILALVLFCLFCVRNVSASELCSKSGYTISTVNGIFTDEEGARNNERLLKVLLKDTYKNQKLNYQYFFNPTHVAGLGDIVDVVRQGFFDQKSDYDLVEMLNDASQKVSTQKVLLVAHSQGNFYANNFYNKVADKEGGVPSESIGVYSVATPADHVAGGGKYLTSDTDQIIASLVGGTLKRNIVSPNTHIVFQNSDDPQGHDFSKIYLKYQGDRIVSDIKSSLDKLKENDEQDSESPCISAPKLTLFHRAEGLALAVADPTAGVVKWGVVTTYDAGAYVRDGVSNVGLAIGSFIHNSTLAIAHMVGGLLASVGNSLPSGNSLATGIAGFSGSANDSPLEEYPLGGGGNTSTPSQSATQEEGNNNPMVVASADDETAPPDITTEATPPLAVDTDNNSENTTTGKSSGTPSPSQNSSTTLLLGTGGSATPATPSDTTPPIITLLGNSSETVKIGSTYSDAGVTALDDTDGDITANVVTVNPVDTNKIADYTITYDVKDAAGNSATEVTRLVHVIALPPPPLINTTISENTTLSAGEYNYDNLVITNKAVLTLQGDPNSINSFKGVKITVVNLTIDNGSSISADGTGYNTNQGPGVSTEFSVGASYGGFSHGGSISSVTYGSATKPTDLGSGGAYYGIGRGGGGAIYLVVSNTFTNNGVVSADAYPSSSGGSIYVSANTMAGNGKFNANGGALYGNGYFKSPGGGGRIALYYKTSSFNGTTEAKGGCGSYDGWSMTCAGDGTVGIFDETLNDVYLNSSAWKFLQADAPFSFNNIYISNDAKVTSENGVTIAANSILLDKNSIFTLAENQVLNIPAITLDGRSVFTLSGSEKITANSLVLKGNSIFTVVPEKILSLTIPNITIASGSSIAAYGKGYVEGPGAPSLSWAGASYGGIGAGNTPTSIYGSEMEPVDFGSGGYGPSRGGGAIRLVVDNLLSNDGIISADGDSTSSGGSIYVTTRNLTGNGTISANGGSASCSNICTGPGGGGRVAIYYGAYSFTGQVLANGAVTGVGTSEAGTVKKIDTSIPVQSSLKTITTFDFTSLTPNVIGNIDETSHTISLTVPFGTDVVTLTPTINISPKASISPSSNTFQNFSTPVTYTVTAEDGSTQDYVVTLTVASDPNPPPDTTPPVLVSARVSSVNMIEVTFSKDINGTTVNTTGNEFVVTGYTVSNAHKLTGGIIILTLSTNIGAGENPSITFTSTNFKDMSGNQAVSPATVIATNSI